MGNSVSWWPGAGPLSESMYYAVVTSAAAVPEIDGALIPQVGLLLAGLFVILGRRKENTEPVLAVKCRMDLNT